MEKYQVLSPLLHNGKRYEVGEIVEMTTLEATASSGLRLLVQIQNVGKEESGDDPLINLPKGKK